MKNRKFVLAMFIIFSTAFFAFINYYIVSSYIKDNPILKCDGDQFSENCLLKNTSVLLANKQQFIQCSNSLKYSTSISDDKDYASSISIDAAPSIIITVSKDGAYKGFNAPVANYEELKTIIADVQKNGIEIAQANSYKVSKGKVEKNIDDYLKAQGFEGQKYNEEYAKLIPQVSVYYNTFNLRDYATDTATILGSGDIKIFYFVDFGGAGNNAFSTEILNKLLTDYVDKGIVELRIKDYAISNELTNSVFVANLLRCAGEQGKYREAFDQINILK